jgi:folate-binding protein YgfZ
MDAGPLESEVAALEDGAALDISTWHRTQVTGADAVGWLDGLLTAGIARLPERASARSLLLAPTGHVRADLFLYRAPDAFVILQPPGQPGAIDELLAPYVLSSDVALGDDRPTRRLSVVPRADRAWSITESEPSEPARASVGMAAFEIWRVRRGLPWFPVDFDEHSVPAEARLEATIDLSKGCFLGQESVARVRNLGHPGRLVLALRANAQVSAGESVVADGEAVGAVTSAAPIPGGSATIARVRWGARARALRTASGVRLRLG